MTKDTDSTAKIVLAGDIGGTKTLLALVSPDRPVTAPISEERFLNQHFDNFEAVLHRFLNSGIRQPTAGCLGVAGRISEGRCRITNLPWTIDAGKISRDFNIPAMTLINDLQAVAMAVPHLEDNQIAVINQGRRDPAGVIGVIAPGTGLGESFLTPSGKGYQAWPSEGGHASFAPVNIEQLELLTFLERRFGHVSFERVCSGSGVPNLYDYLLSTGRYKEPQWLSKEIARTDDLTPLLLTAGYERKAPICIAVLDLFVRILGAVAGNMALKVMATGGIYLGGGIVRRMADRLNKKDFMDALCYKGRFRDWLMQVPVHAILDPKVALHGAAWQALETMPH